MYSDSLCLARKLLALSSTANKLESVSFDVETEEYSTEN